MAIKLLSEWSFRFGSWTAAIKLLSERILGLTVRQVGFGEETVTIKLLSGRILGLWGGGLTRRKNARQI